jgi:hypothetical protein
MSNSNTNSNININRSNPDISDASHDSDRAVKDAPAFDFYPERWSQGTRHLTKVERCDYLDLLGFQWSNDGLPGELDAIARILGYRKASQIPAAVLEKFPLCEDGKRRNARLEVIRSEQRERIRKRKERGKLAAATRWLERDGGGGSPGERRRQKRRGADANALLEHRSGDACPMLKHLENDANAMHKQCPPPTTHHPPQDSVSSPPASRPTLEQARTAANQVGVTVEEADAWWHAREASGWMRGMVGGGTVAVGLNWHADLKAYTNRAHERKAHLAAKAKPPPVGAAGAMRAGDSSNPRKF